MLREDVGELACSRRETAGASARLVEPVFGFMVPHGQQRHHQFVGVSLGQPGHVLVDDALDRVAGLAAACRAGLDVSSKPSMLSVPHQSVKFSRNAEHVCAQSLDVFGTACCSTEAAMVSRLWSACVCACSKLIDQMSLCGEALKSFTTIRIAVDRALEIAAGIGERCRIA